MEGQLFEMEEPASGPDAGDVAGQPLAARMRPRSLGEFVGQEHLLARGSALRTAIEDGKPHSMILYGPPGTGKTTLARLLAVNACAAFEEASAVNAGRAEVRAVIDRAHVPELDALMSETGDVRMAQLAEALGGGPMIALALDFWTWRRLAAEGLSDAEAASLMARAAKLS